MRHRVKKIKFKKGKDANKMLMKKLAVNFLTKGKITTTKAKAKALKSYLEKLVSKAKKPSEADKNVVYKKLGNRKIAILLLKQISPSIQNLTSGYFKLSFLGQRSSDGSEMVKIEWSLPVVINKEEKIKKKNKS